MNNALGKIFAVENSKNYKIAQMEKSIEYNSKVDSAAIIGGSAIICTAALILSKGIGFIASRMYPAKAVIPVVKAGKKDKNDKEA